MTDHRTQATGGFHAGSLSGILEQAMDKHSLLDVIIALECLCADKAEHLQVNWQDKASAACWARAGRALAKAARDTAVLAVS